MKKLISIFMFMLLFLFGSSVVLNLNTQIYAEAVQSEQKSEAEKVKYRVIASYPHSKSAFTQGLEFYEGYLYEGTGLYGRSSLKKLELKTGKTLKERKLADLYFGEGITIFNENIYQLTWKKGKLFIYDLNFNLLKIISYNGEGWGLSNNGRSLIMSDGSEYIYYRDPNNFQILKRIKILFNGKALQDLNELEYIDGYIYANVWQKDIIVKINPNSGRVVSYLDLKSLLDKSKYQYEINVLNGIAYIEERGSLLITGKLWPKIFEIKLLNSTED